MAKWACMYCPFECVFSELAQLLPTSVPSLISHLLVSQLLHEFCINMLEFVYLFADLPALERAKCCFTATHSHIQALGTLSKIIWLKQLSIHICVCVRMYLAQRLLSWHSVACLSSTLQSKLSIFYLFFHTFLLTGQLRATDIDFFFFFFIFFLLLVPSWSGKVVYYFHAQNTARWNRHTATYILIQMYLWCFVAEVTVTVTVTATLTVCLPPHRINLSVFVFVFCPFIEHSLNTHWCQLQTSHPEHVFKACLLLISRPA